MMGDLVERLRWASKMYRSHQEYEMTITREAADHIEALEAKVERLTRQLAVSQEAINRLMGDLGDATIAALAGEGDEDEPRVTLSPADSRAFAEALLNPPEPNDALKQLMQEDEDA